MSTEPPVPPAGSTTRRRLTREQRHDLILEHAIAVFGTRGYHNVSMDDVAEHAGISKALVYQHFESKDDLYMEVMRVYQERIAESVLPAWSADLPQQERFWRGFVAFFTFVEQNRQSWGVLNRDAVEINDSMVRGIHTLNVQMAELIAEVFKKDLGERDSDPLLTQYALAAGHAVVGACHALADYWLEHPEETVFRLAATAMAVLWKGFGEMIGDGQPWFPTEEMLKGLV